MASLRASTNLARAKYVPDRSNRGAVTLVAGAAARSKMRPLTFDAMGEVRFEYDAALVGQMHASGLDAITVTLCDPKAYEGQAYEEAVQAVLDLVTGRLAPQPAPQPHTHDLQEHR